MTTRLKPLYLAALLLPLMFLAFESAYNLYHRAHAPAYTVVIEGYDPRDLVYGEYIQFRLNWTDPASEKPDMTADKLPDTARIYLPEGHAWDLQTMMWERKHRFTARVSLAGRRAIARDLKIDGEPWQGRLDTWLDTRAGHPAAKPTE